MSVELLSHRRLITTLLAMQTKPFPIFYSLVHNMGGVVTVMHAVDS